ncbi:MAG: tripartite tricarboxylate transporter substrate binding protein [Burkholderiales bacterium]|nr:tripartite tricarboxylate transporter substrate binding protein [Burkholderiales bacterium]
MTSPLPRRPALPATRRTLLKAAGAAATLAAAGAARAQAWPAGKPIRIVLPSGAGGGADIFGRFMAEWLSKELGTSVIVDNKPGANGLLATQEVARAAPDGFTLLVSFTAATVANKLLMLKPPVDPLNDIVPIARIGGGGGNMVVVNPTLPVKNMRELVEYARTRNDLSYASWGIGSGGHLVMESIKAQSGMKLVHVPYKTVAQIPPDVISGVMPIATIDAASPLPHLRSGRMRAIGTLSGERLPQLKDTPTVIEQGFKLDAFPWYGLFGPKALPREIVDRMNATLNRWMVLPEVAEFFDQKQNGPAPKPLSVAEFEKLIQSDLVSWKQLIDVAGVKPE